MSLRKSNFLLLTFSTALSTSNVISNSQFINNKVCTNYIFEDNRKSLTSMFVDNKFDETVHVGQAANLTVIKKSEIETAIDQEVNLELTKKTQQEVTKQIDYQIEITTLEDNPLPAENNLSQPINLQVKINANKYSKILKDQVILKCEVNYPIFDLDEFLKNGLKMLYSRNHPGEMIYFSKLEKYKAPIKTNLVVTTVGKPIINKSIDTYNYFGEAIFQNDTDVAQTYPTQAWSKKVSSQSSVLITRGVNAGLQTNVDAFGVNINVDFKTQKTDYNGEEQTITAPSVPTIVQPHHRVQVATYLNAIVSSQNITIDNDISGNVSATFCFSNWSTEVSANVIDIVKYYQDIGECPKAILLKQANQIVHLQNQAKIVQYNTGTLWRVITTPLD